MKISSETEGKTRDWADKRRIAAGWLEVPRLAERLRRRRKGELIMKLNDAGTGYETGASREAPSCRTTSPVLRPLVREEDRGDDG